MKERGNEIDMQRTRELHLPGALVVAGKGDATHFFCIPNDAGSKLRCPRCDNDSIRNQGDMKREYLDVIPMGDGIAAVTVSLSFRKSKCLSPECGCVFYSKIPFASQYSRTTRRLEVQ